MHRIILSDSPFPISNILTQNKKLSNNSTSRGVRIWGILAQVITGDVCCSSSVPYMACIAHVVTGVWCDEVCICDAHVCTVLRLAGRVSFSTLAPVQSLTTGTQRRTETRILSPSSM